MNCCTYKTKKTIIFLKNSSSQDAVLYLSLNMSKILVFSRANRFTYLILKSPNVRIFRTQYFEKFKTFACKGKHAKLKQSNILVLCNITVIK